MDDPQCPIPILTKLGGVELLNEVLNQQEQETSRQRLDSDFAGYHFKLLTEFFKTTRLELHF